MDTLYATLLIALCFIIRAIPRQYQPEARNLDTFFHLFFARKIRQEGHLPHYSVPNFPYKPYYPWAYHKLLALFPLAWHERLERISAATFDSLTAILIYNFSAWAFRESPNSATLALAATALFVFSPALLRMGSGPRAYSGSPRVMGQTLYLTHILLAHVAITTNSLVAAGLSLMAGVGMVMTAKFANQVLLFFGIVLALVCNPLYLAFSIGSLALALLIFRGKAWHILRAQTEHSILYFTFFRHVFMGFAPRTLKDYKASWKEHGQTKLKNKQYIRFLYWMLDEQFPAHFFVVCYLPAFFVPFASSAVIAEPTLNFLWSFVFAAMTWFLLTKTKLMMFLGEGERYLEYAISGFLILAVAATGGNWLMYVLLGYTIILGITCVFRACVMLRNVQIEADKHQEALEFLSTRPEGTLLVYGNSYYQALYWGNNPVAGFSLKDEDALIDREPFVALWKHTPLPSYDFAQVIRHFSPRYLYGQKWAFDCYRENVKDLELFESSLKLIHDNERVQVYEVMQSETTTVERD